MRILFVEDNQTNRHVVRQMLTAGGIDMDEAEDGPTGLRMLSNRAYDLVLMDLRMPGMDGLTAIRTLREGPSCNAGLPVIVVTADASPSVSTDCLDAGADDVLQKPIEMPRLFETIARLLLANSLGETVIA